MNTSILTPAQRADFDRDGYVLVRKLFDDEEIALLRGAIEQDPAIRANFYARTDGGGLATRIALWNHPGDSAYGLAARSRRVVDTMEDLLGGEVYHYHSKLTAKDPFEGGAWEWHQDYGYWYHNGCLLPDMGSVMIALDRCTPDNGCLQVVRGSHRCGRIEHGVLPGEQIGANMERVAQILQRMEVVHAEMEPGDGLFFHANTLHRSDQNRSAARRWTLLCCYNTARNDPYKPHGHPGYTPLDKVDDGALKAAGMRLAADDAAFRRKAPHPDDVRRQAGAPPA